MRERRPLLQLAIFLLRRLLRSALLLLAVSFLSFLLLQLAPGDFVSEMRVNPQVSAETVAGLRQQYGLDQPLLQRYGRWVASLFAGELGFSFAYNRPVAPILFERTLNTLLLSGAALVLTWVVGLPIGVWSASRKGRPADTIATAGMGALHTIPDILFAIVFLMIAVLTGILPTGGMRSLNYDELSAGAKALDLLRHLALPVLALTLANIPTVVRHVRSAMGEALSQPFVRTATAAGVGRARILWRHALPAAINPLASLFGLSIAGMLSSSLLVEVIMSWPGLGPLLLEAVFARDVYVVIGSVVVSTLFLVLGSLISDVLLFGTDPRIKSADAR